MSQLETDRTRGDFENEPVRSRNPITALLTFIREVFAEMRKVVTPTGRELASYSVIVVLFVVVMIALIFGLDFAFAALSRLVFVG
ncbi:preprotein translocase subunit SecE [Helcobacillus massiliensis]|uniref:Protein translocase subunit SecE n=1 Tax=Helcobacillus massiliensis TaxID=521392 RepID=A0A839QSG3_9MICO|nr:preprotein translocase subunit SecE [Helcobacillus massiliensis]MBB3022972.1 preprotein translocase subunit SecE [Helcobacillus massiliensis]MCT1558327.1 preprotein translocase subunit SecE [Helcobacillus massiliensis]MCT2037324.1 preprotein translocase subunit SecE [Helcobacillus massiliensis]MCT2332344.1 preprotein translocase subunit SecE [Helcobacillus massiliensis]MDK7742543.1 preprotein translocase subunit SecE [Helcobacillus massiliensis]